MLNNSTGTYPKSGKIIESVPAIPSGFIHETFFISLIRAFEREEERERQREILENTSDVSRSLLKQRTLTARSI